MCGLVGIAGDLTGVWKDLFSELLLFDVVRGPHSTGAGFVDRGGDKFTLVKRPGHPFNLFDAQEFETAMGIKNSPKIIMGHNRYATIGEKSEANAHPFMFKNILGMHNGTLDKFSINNMPGNEVYGTDSECIFANLDETKDVAETLKLMHGAWALVWYDKRTKKLNFLRNDRRPLHYCYSEDRCTLIWSSELELLKYVMGRRNKKVAKDDKGEPAFFVANQDTMLSWEIPTSINGKFDAPEQVPVKGKQWSTITTFMGGSTVRHTAATTTQNSTTNAAIVDDYLLRVNTTNFRPPYKDHYGHIVNKHAFTQLVDEGCAFCGEAGQDWGDFIKIMSHYCGPKNTPYICETCYNDPDYYEYLKYAI